MKPFPVQKPASPPVAIGPVVSGTDFSPAAGDGVAVAADIARNLGASLILAHVLKLPHALRRDAKASRWVVASRKRFLRTATEEVRAPGLEVIDTVRTGHTHKVLAETAAAERARMIVLGSPYRRIFARFPGFGVAKKLIGHATTPTLILRATHTFRAWLQGERPLRVLVCFNFTPACDAALRWVKQLAAAGPLDVVVGRIGPPSDARDMDVITRTRATLGELPVRYRTAAPSGRTASGLVRFSNEENADLIVAGTKRERGLRRLWRRSVAGGILNRARTSVAIVPLSMNQDTAVSAHPAPARPRRRRSSRPRTAEPMCA